MGFTLEEALVETQDQYMITLLAGKKGCGNSISWVHLIEDTLITQQLWGKELVVTTGLGFQDHKSLRRLVECLVKYHSVGLIINTGKYIFDIPKDIIEYCNENDLPLMTSPWNVHMADLIKDFSMRCLYSEREDRQVSKFVKNAFNDRKKIEESRIELSSTFDVDGYFQVLFIDIEDSSQLDTIGKRRATFQLELYFEKIDCINISFWYEGYFVLLVNNLDEMHFEEVVEQMYKRSRKRMDDKQIYIGVGSRVCDFRNIMQSYKRAYSAVNMATQFYQPIVYFKDMGIYQVLFSIDDKEILYDLYNHMLSPLKLYDEQHNSELEKTLYYYLICDGSPQLMAKKLYMHRNTIHYRLNKIKELLNIDLSAYEERFPLMLAFYIKEMFVEQEKKELI